MPEAIDPGLNAESRRLLREEIAALKAATSLLAGEPGPRSH